MPFKINISHKGKTIKFEEIENESLIDKAITDKIKGEEISPDLKEYELEITGTSDKAGFPGSKDIEGAGLKRVLLKKGKFMHNKTKGIRLRKTLRGKLISASTIQINTKVIKEGTKKFDTLIKPKEGEVKPEGETLKESGKPEVKKPEEQKEKTPEKP